MIHLTVLFARLVGHFRPVRVLSVLSLARLPNKRTLYRSLAEYATEDKSDDPQCDDSSDYKNHEP